MRTFSVLLPVQATLVFSRSASSFSFPYSSTHSSTAVMDAKRVKYASPEERTSSISSKTSLSPLTGSKEGAPKGSKPISEQILSPSAILSLGRVNPTDIMPGHPGPL